ncbi:MAG: protein adenylyltransferase SelO family protein, partial [Gammaproteobacteria bacterium]
MSLPDVLRVAQAPAAAPAPELIIWNHALAQELGLVSWQDDAAARCSGARLPRFATPVALAYAGHQFGQFVPQLGDGRALLLGERIDVHGVRRDLQLKGSGRTVFSRGGDGKSPLGPVLREYLVSEAMHVLGVPTTRSLAAVTTGVPVLRESLSPGAVLTRVARSHVRVGTFEF